MKKVIFCTPTITKPFQAYLDSMEKTVPFLEERGWECQSVYEIGCPYISHARAKLLRQALDELGNSQELDRHAIVFIDHDLGWEPEDMLRLIDNQHYVCGGTYRFKRDDKVEFMGLELAGPNGGPLCWEEDQDILYMHSLPAGFLKITANAVNVIMAQYPELCFGDRYHPYVDLFQHGAHDWTWYGEDYAFSRRWRELPGCVLTCPADLNLVHYSKDADGNEVPYGGRFIDHLLDRGKKNPLKIVKQDSAA